MWLDKMENEEWPQLLTSQDIRRIAQNANLPLFEDMTAEDRSNDREKDFFRAELNGWKGTALLTFKPADYMWGGMQSVYTINLKTGAPTKNSTIQTKIPEDIQQRMIHNGSKRLETMQRLNPTHTITLADCI